MTLARRTLPVLDDEAAQLSGVCRRLRTKSAFIVTPTGMGDWRSGASTTAVYWCLATMETFGADDAVCHPSACREGRVCFVPSADTTVA